MPTAVLGTVSEEEEDDPDVAIGDEADDSDEDDLCVINLAITSVCENHERYVLTLDRTKPPFNYAHHIIKPDLHN